MVEKSLFFIAIIPPEPIKSKVMNLKVEFSKKYNTYHALKSPPHITLIPPFRISDTKTQDLTKKLERFSSIEKTFSISTNGFGAFAPRVIYISIDRNENLSKLYIRLISEFNEVCSNKNFKPHMTIAFRDITTEIFRKAWSEYEKKPILQTFQVNSLYLLKHNGKSWDVVDEFPFHNLVLPI